ncbi:LysR family transcriptional regulator [Azospirillum sp. SYSU D00513]|uniref:LysR family transcriptional regulator n=1 Tax=Azospirillum sp. SYSU D00513 TaxID=2812561 RepID=UPI001A96C045|nr:LysR family transcriptional regulator [Azospirillum sp. SYSU D00513]
MIDLATLDWEDVRAFLEIARRGNLPDAARALGVSAATIGRRLQRLERLVGAALFDRLPNRLALTALGRELAEAGAAMRQGAEAFARMAMAGTALDRAPVRVTATGSLSLFLAGQAGWLADRLAEAGAAMEILTSKATLDLAGGEAEIALRMRRLPLEGPLTARRLGRVAFGVYAARAAAGQRIEAGESAWASLPVIGLPLTGRAPSQSRWLDDRAAAQGSRVGLRIADVSARHRAVRAGGGASLLPCFLGDADPLLVRLSEPPEELAEDVHLMRHDQPRNPSATRAVTEILAALFQEQGRALRGEAGGAVPSPA